MKEMNLPELHLFLGPGIRDPAGPGTAGQHPAGDTLRLILRDPAGRILDEVEVNADQEDPVELVTDKAVLWHGVQDPALLELIGQLRRMGTVKDEIRLFTGLRTYSLDLHGNFLLNGRPYPVKGRILSGEESLQQLAEQGYTAVWDRSGHTHTWLLNACDRLGLVMFSSIGSCHEAQMQTAQGHVCLCFWIQDQDEVPGRDATRLSLDRSLLEIQGQEFSLKTGSCRQMPVSRSCRIRFRPACTGVPVFVTVN